MATDSPRGTKVIKRGTDIVVIASETDIIISTHSFTYKGYHGVEPVPHSFRRLHKLWEHLTALSRLDSLLNHRFRHLKLLGPRNLESSPKMKQKDLLLQLENLKNKSMGWVSELERFQKEFLDQKPKLGIRFVDLELKPTGSL
ncbi:MAG: hypothetical protein Q9221_008965 [Calogaya cf. arnoldii]